MGGPLQHAAEKGLHFLSSPFPRAAAFSGDIGVPPGKSRRARPKLALLEGLLADGLPILVSTGMSPMGDIDGAVRQVKAAGVPVAGCVHQRLPLPAGEGRPNMIPFSGSVTVALSAFRPLRHDFPGLAAACLASRSWRSTYPVREMFAPTSSPR